MQDPWVGLECQDVHNNNKLPVACNACYVCFIYVQFIVTDKGGYFMTMGIGTGKLQSDSLFQANTNYCLTFWFYLFGPADFEFIVQTTVRLCVIVCYHSVLVVYAVAFY